MKKPNWIAAVAIIGAGVGGPAGTALAQEEVMLAPGTTVEVPVTGWQAFSRSESSTFLINGGGVVAEGDEVRVRVARVPKAGTADDYSHVIDDFAVRCDASQSHLIASAEAYEDGVPTEAFDADEPWADVQPGSFDEALLEIGCGRARASGSSFADVKAYIDAGRP